MPHSTPRVLPNLLIVGAHKCGTTSLHAYLEAHPQIFMTRPKEPHFFSHNWERGIDWYAGLFERGAGALVRGEASPTYAKAPQVPDVPRRIASVLPDVRILYLVRHPLDRIRSHYRDDVHLGKERARTLSEAVERSPVYLDWTRYGYQIDHYLDFFPRDRLLIVATEDLRTRRERALADILEFLGLEKVLPPELAREWNPGDAKGRVPWWAEAPRRVWQRMAPLTGRVPRSRRRWLRSRLSRPMSADSLAIPPALEARIWGELGPDLARLRAIVGPGFKLWGRA